MENIISKVETAFKNNVNKWTFLNETTESGNNIKLKFFVGVKETDLQIFSVNNLNVNLGFNYASKTKTKKAIIEILKNV